LPFDGALKWRFQKPVTYRSLHSVEEVHSEFITGMCSLGCIYYMYYANYWQWILFSILSLCHSVAQHNVFAEHYGQF